MSGMTRCMKMSWIALREAMSRDKKTRGAMLRFVVLDAVGRPGHTTGLPVEVTIDEMAAAMGFAVGKRAGAPDGSSVTFDLTDMGEVGGRPVMVLELL